MLILPVSGRIRKKTYRSTFRGTRRICVFSLSESADYRRGEKRERQSGKCVRRRASERERELFSFFLSGVGFCTDGEGKKKKQEGGGLSEWTAGRTIIETREEEEEEEEEEN